MVLKIVVTFLFYWEKMNVSKIYFQKKDFLKYFQIQKKVSFFTFFLSFFAILSYFRNTTTESCAIGFNDTYIHLNTQPNTLDNSNILLQYFHTFMILLRNLMLLDSMIHTPESMNHIYGLPGICKWS
jgi:hypothetical protein